MSCEAINFCKKLPLFDEQWKPRVIAEMNDYQFKLVKLKGTSFGTTIRKRRRRLL